MRILVVKLSALGDVIHALPVVTTLKGAYPTSRIDWLVEEMAEPIVRCHPEVDGVLVSRRGGWLADLKKPPRWPVVCRELNDLIRQLRRQKYDLAIDLQGLLKSGIWMSLAPARRKLGYDGTREGSYLFLNDRIPPVSPDLHAVDRYLALVKAVGANASKVDFGLSVLPEARESLRNLIKSSPWDESKPYAVLVPTARWETKEWGAASFASLADRLFDEFGLQSAITGVHEDAPTVEEIMKRMRRQAVNLAGKTDLHTLMALMEGARVVISTDSGPMHLAAAIGTPVVGVFGPTAPWRTGPYGKGHRAIRSSITCSPCFQRQCSHKTCMARVRHQEVLAAVHEVLVQDEPFGIQKEACRFVTRKTRN
jgi:lipopolysaccharide heptosyltransferase I